MNQTIKRTIKQGLKRLLLAYKQGNEPFQPYIKKLDICGIDCRFFYATPQSQQWYDPLKPFAQAEYEWVIEHVSLQGERIIDGGAHHGQYSLVFASAAKQTSDIISVDPFPMNCDLIEVNMRLNQYTPHVCQGALSYADGTVHFLNMSNGRIVSQGGIPVASKRLQTIMPDVTVVKLDIEGAEFDVIPGSIDELKQAHTYIIEVHPHNNNQDPDDLIRLFLERDFDVSWVNRDNCQVEPYHLGTDWKIHSTIIARRG